MLPSPVSSSSSAQYTSLACRRSLLQRPVASVHNIPRSPSVRFFYRRRTLSPRFCTIRRRAVAGQVGGSRKDGEEEEDDGAGLEFIDVGFVSSAHGIKGEVRLKPNTGFPELRFCKPGRRWIRSRVLGVDTISEMQLTGGRNHPGQKCWIITFEGIDTVDKAKQIVGSTLLVREGDKPELQEDEFYTHDLVGMKVIHKESGILVGTVANVFNFGANDLLHVMRASSSTRKDILDHTYSSPSEIKIDPPDQFVWIPFVEAIVPEVDMERREMIITPPKGLLELNFRSDMRTKKERRQMEWKQKKKLKQQISATKKVMLEMGQCHLLDGLNIGEKGSKG